MTRVLDRGAIVAGYVGIGMALTIAISFLLVIPIEPVYWYLSVPAGLLIGYYANARSDRRGGPWGRVIANALYAGVVTALTLALLLLGVKALFFAADDGYRDASAGGRLTCAQGAGCVYARYLADGQGDKLVAAGVSDLTTFTRFYWNQQLATTASVLTLTVVGGLGGGIVYGAANRRRPEPVGPVMPG